MTEQVPSKEQLLSMLRDGVAAAEGNLSRDERVVSVHSHWLKNTCQAALEALQSSHEPCDLPRILRDIIADLDHNASRIDEPVAKQIKARIAAYSAPPPPADLPKPINHDLWRHLHDEHGLTLLQSELDEILRIAQPPGAKRWIPDQCNCEYEATQADPRACPMHGTSRLVVDNPSPTKEAKQ